MSAHLLTTCGSVSEQLLVDVFAWPAQVAVAVFHRMNLAKHQDKAAAAQHFARALHDSWGVGNPDCQNGALLLLAVGDRQVGAVGGTGMVWARSMPSGPG
jgi:hypothetical protein